MRRSLETLKETAPQQKSWFFEATNRTSCLTFELIRGHESTVHCLSLSRCRKATSGRSTSQVNIELLSDAQTGPSAVHAPRESRFRF
uniref:Uncharacterized protein n=1 Tax=Peronospora matthiolae TaxID=2874970 RepID=A0AAV1UD75_9STRA